jgi:predicted aminopeptidase
MISPARIVRRVLLVVALLLLGFLTLSPTGRYLARAAWAEGHILARRKAIPALIASPATDPVTRAKLQLVLAARTFAVDSVRLRAEESFTTYSRLDSDTLVLVLSAAYRDRLRSYTWWFPIVGRVPYKGFFDPRDALAAARDLEQRGLDTYVRPASAFSTLGWFDDPLVSSTLHEDSASLVNTVIHELTHNTFYAPGQAVFNESFANFVGAHGAMWYFRTRGDTANLRASEEDWGREVLYGTFLEGVYHSLDSAFAAHPGSAADRIAAREAIYARARTLFVDSILPRFPGYRPGTTVRFSLNNARLFAQRVYRTGLEQFDAVLAAEGGDLRRANARIIALARSKPSDPYGAVRAWVAAQRQRGGAIARGAAAARSGRAEAPAQHRAKIE